MVEIVISIAAILIVLSLGRLGMLFGLFYGMTSTLFLFSAMMITLRYWHALTCWIVSLCSPDAACYAAFGAYWALFLVGCLPLILIMNRVPESSMPKYPKSLDVSLGFVFGTIAAAVLVCSVMTSLSVIAPKVWEPYNRDALLLPLDKVPISIYQTVENKWLHISVSDPGHTRFPTFNKEDVDDFSRYWR